MANAGYDPREAMGVLQMLEDLFPSGPDLLSDHPSCQERKANLRRWLRNNHRGVNMSLY